VALAVPGPPGAPGPQQVRRHAKLS